MVSNIYDLFDKRRPAPTHASTATAPAVLPPAAGLHPYAEAIRRAWLARLDALAAKPWQKGDAWDHNCFITARKLIELANSPWAGYSLNQAHADYMSHAPRDHAWDQREKCWEQGRDYTGTDSLPEPPPGELPNVTTITAGPPPPDLAPDAEANFWDARPFLRHIHDFARARRTSPWAVLGVVLARAVTATPHQVCLPPIVGSRGSLNMFIGLVGPSGAGKGAATGTAADAVHISDVKTMRLASGEAIAHLYKRKLTKAEREAGESDWTDHSHARLIDVSEIDRFAAQSNRQGSTLMADLRSAWSGEMLGQVAADPTRSFIVEPHQYRLTLVAGIQPHRAQVLLDDEDGGTPQRFVWLPVTDPDAPDERPAEPTPLTWSPPRISGLVGVGGAPMSIAPQIVNEIDAARLATLRGEGDPLDGHKNQSQLKIAAALALTDDRTDITLDDWALARTVMQKSDATRGAVIAAMAARASEESRRRAESDAVRAVVVEERTLEAAIKRVCTSLTRRLRRTPGWVSYSELRRSVSSSARRHFEDALQRLVEAGQIEFDPAATQGGNGAYRLIEGDE